MKNKNEVSSVQAIAFMIFFGLGVALGFWLDKPMPKEDIARWEQLKQTDDAIIEAFADDTKKNGVEIILTKTPERKKILSELGY